MTPEQIESMLDDLASLQSLLDEIALQKQECIDRVLAPVKDQLDSIEEEFAVRTAHVSDEIAALTNRIKTAVLQHGSTVRGRFLQAVWSKGRAKWDTRALQGYAKAHPEVLEFYQEGDPSVSIRKV